MLSGSESNVGAVVAILVAQGFVCGGLSGTIAGAKGYEAGTWFFGGFLFGPLGLIAAAGLPTKASREFFLTRKCGACAEAVRIESKRCRHCGEPGTARDTDDAISDSIKQDHEHRVAAMAIVKTLPKDSQELHLTAMLALRDHDSEIAVLAAQHLVELGAPAGLVAVFRSGYSTEAALAKLKALGDRNLIPIFQEALESPLQEYAIDGLASFGGDPLLTLLREPGFGSKQLRKAICKRLERI
ncbi:MAG: hypothetical protein ABL998_21120 [Planctomycetota bacterium]